MLTCRLNEMETCLLAGYIAQLFSVIVTAILRRRGIKIEIVNFGKGGKG